MIEAPLPANEDERLAALESYNILDTDPEQAFDDLTRVAARMCGTPIALVSLIDTDRQWFKSKVGLDASETPRSLAFCSHAIHEPDEVMVVEDATKDHRFRDNPLVTGAPYVIFYAGAPLVTPEGIPLGTLCVIDEAPRALSEDELDTLRSLARATVSLLELRKTCVDLRDISRRFSRSNRELEKRNGEIRRFYQTLSHELKTPLTVVRDYVSMVLEGLAGDIGAQQRQFLTIGLENCDRMTRHVNDLLDVTRIETGKLRLNFAPVSLGTLLESAVEGLRPTATRASVTLTADPGPDLPEIQADADRILQVVTNLVRNAIKFTPEGGRVLVEARPASPPEASVLVSVSDTGCGISQENLGRIFERLFQCRDEDAGSRQGLGIGLHLSHEIVQLHGGRMSVESHEGSGSTFHFWLPVQQPAAATAAPPVREETRS